MLARARRSCPSRAGRPCAATRRSRSGGRSSAPGSSRARPRSWPRSAPRRARPRARRRAPTAARAGTGSGAGSCDGRAARASASSGVTQAEIDVANDLPRNGPSGWYSHACRSRALQSLSSTTPKTWPSASLDRHALAVRARVADHEAQLELDVELAARAEGGLAVLPAGTARTAARRRCRRRRPCPRGRGSRRAAGASWAAAARRRAGTCDRGSSRGAARRRSRRSRRRRTAGAARRRRAGCACASARGSPRSAAERRAGRRPGGRARGHERVERRRGEGAAEPVDQPGRGEPGEVDHVVALERPGARRAAGRGEDAEGVVRGPHAAG